MTDAQQRREYRYRGSRAAVVVGMCAPLGAAAVALLKWVLDDEGVPLVLPLAVGGVCVALVALVILSALSAATVVDERHVTIRELRRERSTAWPDVQAVEIEEASTQSQEGTRVRHVAVLYDTAGRRRPLPYVSSQACADLQQEADWLRQMWVLHRGADWRPSPAAEARLARRGRSRLPGWAGTLLVALCVGLCVGLGAVVVSMLLAAVTYTAGSEPPGTLVLFLWVPLAAAAVATAATAIVQRRRQA